MSTEPTIFSRIINREIPADIVYEDDKVLAFRDINPVAPVHILIIPKEPIAQISQMEQHHTSLLGHMMWVATQVAQQESLSGYRLVMNNGSDGGQTVYHIHLHLIGGRQMAWPPG